MTEIFGILGLLVQKSAWSLLVGGLLWIAMQVVLIIQKTALLFLFINWAALYLFSFLSSHSRLLEFL